MGGSIVCIDFSLESVKTAALAVYFWVHEKIEIG